MDILGILPMVTTWVLVSSPKVLGFIILEFQDEEDS